MILVYYTSKNTKLLPYMVILRTGSQSKAIFASLINQTSFSSAKENHTNNVKIILMLLNITRLLLIKTLLACDIIIIYNKNLTLITKFISFEIVINVKLYEKKYIN